jgi:hypothetical protein
MGAAESKTQGSGTAGGEGFSKAKLSFSPGATVLQSTSVYALRDAYFGKRPVSAFSYDPAQFELDDRHEFLPKAIRVSCYRFSILPSIEQQCDPVRSMSVFQSGIER